MGMNYEQEWSNKLTKQKDNPYNVKAWIEDDVIKCISQQCIIKENGIMIDCPRFNECENKEIIVSDVK